MRTLENIKKGSFVVQYVGEVITSDEAEERGKKYDADGKTYLFDLDFNLGDENPYTVRPPPPLIKTFKNIFIRKKR